MQTIKPAFNTTAVPVIFSCDNAYAPYLGVCIHSLVLHANPNKNYDILILDGGITAERKKMITVGIPPHVSVRFVDVLPRLTDDQRRFFIGNGHISTATYYRFLIADLLPDFDKVCYLDCDAVLTDDVATLFETDIGDTYLGVVHDLGAVYLYHNEERFHTYINTHLKMQDIHHYFNAGVLVMNLKQMRRDAVPQKLMTRLAELQTPRFLDQCVLNSVCENHVTYLPEKWNFLWFLAIHRTDTDFNDPAEQRAWQAYQKAAENPSFVHYASAQKPWLSPELENARYFWQYARMTPFYEEILYQNLKRVVLSPTDNPYLPIVADIVHYTSNRVLGRLYQALAYVTFGSVKRFFSKKYRARKAAVRRVKKVFQNQL